MTLQCFLFHSVLEETTGSTHAGPLPVLLHCTSVIHSFLWEYWPPRLTHSRHTPILEPFLHFSSCLECSFLGCPLGQLPHLSEDLWCLWLWGTRCSVPPPLHSASLHLLLCRHPCTCLPTHEALSACSIYILQRVFAVFNHNGSSKVRNLCFVPWFIPGV